MVSDFGLHTIQLVRFCCAVCQRGVPLTRRSETHSPCKPSTLFNRQGSPAYRRAVHSLRYSLFQSI